MDTEYHITTIPKNIPLVWIYRGGLYILRVDNKTGIEYFNTPFEDVAEKVNLELLRSKFDITPGQLQRVFWSVEDERKKAKRLIARKNGKTL